MIDTEYYWVWGAYLLASLLFTALLWYWTKALPWVELRRMIRILAIVAMFVPWYADGSHSVLAPAWMVGFGDLLTEGPEAFWRSGRVLLIAIITSMVLSTSYHIIAWYRAR